MTYTSVRNAEILFPDFIPEADVYKRQEHAKELVRLISRVRGKLNLIVYNPADGMPYKAPTPERILAFEQYLWSKNITAIIRKSKGQDIKAACGQLKAQALRSGGASGAR